ncbi:anhydro-N-acetylmuramic acid kinase [Longimonas halophila]|uniref:Anhydro-N-acetylmuramic acid kinase n=1 Tax=Longimonas halophila TaxID=1469170 RepID=A0A2H3P5Z9_9BACT|nr:anhydro-N-acetylmuramic acid kinase [Longimonas halophila]PEN06272.1 anhydro-N-acetylmuramic acid kinase [Longimonas halophila]
MDTFLASAFPSTLSERRRVVGLMSGTSFDGVDAVLVELSGSQGTLQIDAQAALHTPYSADLHRMLHDLSRSDKAPLDHLAALHGHLADCYAEAVTALMEQADRPLSRIDLVGVHGQTIVHVPTPLAEGPPGRGTLQVGAPGALAAALNCPVVGDFRPADMALHGQGAPIMPYFDCVVLGDAQETRLMLNLGGIANVTVVPAGASRADVRAFDTGPANMVLDALTELLFDEPYDAAGAYAEAGTPHADVVATLIREDFFQQPPPRSTGRRQFGADYAQRVWAQVRTQDGSRHDALATAVLLTASSVYQAYAQFIRPDAPADRVLVSGGGVHNSTLMQALRNAFAPIPVASTSDVGIDPDMKEAIGMAVLAHEWTHGTATALPSVTGATRAARLGGLHLPPAS